MQAIREKIKELDIQDCKIRVLNVDSQMSLNNIVVQVIGVMSNKAAPSKKFVQTFVLTPQTNGFYVLNDIIRYLNDEEDEIIDDEPVPEPVTEAEAVAEAVPEFVPEPVNAPAESQHEAVDNEESAQQVAAKLEQVANEPSAPSTDEQSEPAAEEVKDTVSIQAEEDTAISAENPPEPEPTPAVLSPPKAATPPPAPEAPPAKKTWANMVGAKVVGTVPAVPAISSSTSVQPKVQKASQPVSTPKQTSSPAEPASSTTAAPSSEWQMADHSKRQNRPQNRNVSDGPVLAYIKNVTEKIEAPKLKQTLEKYGDLKYFDVSRLRVSCHAI